MKKIALALLVLLLVFSLAGCKMILGLFGLDDDDDDDGGTVEYSEWWIKGSFDGWSDNPKHYFAIDELNANKLTFVLTGLRAIDYEFVLVNPAGAELKYTTDANVTLGTAFVMGATTNNASFTAAKVSYTVTVDITTPAAPSVNLIAVVGAANATPYTFAELAAGLKIKGDQFTIGWTDTAGTAGVNTVTFDDLTAEVQNGSFGFSSLDGFLKGVTVASPTAEAGSTTAAGLLTTGDNIKITGIPNENSVYTVVVTINTAGATIADKYSMVVTLKTLGSGGWPRVVPSSIFFVGALDGVAGMTDWSEADSGRKEVTVTSNVATLTYTASAAEAQAFKFALEANAGWTGLIGWGEIDQANSAGVVDDFGNLKFDATLSTIYTITVDFSTYVADGEIVVTRTP